jgi:hypothetical protein
MRRWPAVRIHDGVRLPQGGNLNQINGCCVAPRHGFEPRSQLSDDRDADITWLTFRRITNRIGDRVYESCSERGQGKNHLGVGN